MNDISVIKWQFMYMYIMNQNVGLIDNYEFLQCN